MSIANESEQETDLVYPEVSWEKKLLRLRDVPIRISVQIGQTKLPIGNVLDLREGHVIELGRQVGSPVDVVANEHVIIAKGEVVEVDDEYGVRITEIVPGVFD